MKLPDRHPLAVAILAIGTAAIGFGLFGSGLELSDPSSVSGWAQATRVAKLCGAASSVALYFVLLLSVGTMLSKDKISGRDLASGPVAWLYMLMLSLVWLYVFSIIEGLRV